MSFPCFFLWIFCFSYDKLMTLKLAYEVREIRKVRESTQTHKKTKSAEFLFGWDVNYDLFFLNCNTISNIPCPNSSGFYGLFLQTNRL